MVLAVLWRRLVSLGHRVDLGRFSSDGIFLLVFAYSCSSSFHWSPKPISFPTASHCISRPSPTARTVCMAST